LNHLDVVVIGGGQAGLSIGYYLRAAGWKFVIFERGRVGETYFLAGHRLTLRQLMGVWEATLGRRPVRLWLPRPLALLQGAALAPLLRLLGQPAFISTEVVRSGYVSFQYSSHKAESEMDVRFRPAHEAWRDTLVSEATA